MAPSEAEKSEQRQGSRTTWISSSTAMRKFGEIGCEEKSCASVRRAVMIDRETALNEVCSVCKNEGLESSSFISSK